MSSSEEALKRLVQDQANYRGAAQATGLGATGTCSVVSERDRAEKKVGFHRQEAERADQAAAFFRENPAFDQFICLIKSGVISIY